MANTRAFLMIFALLGCFVIASAAHASEDVETYTILNTGAVDSYTRQGSTINLAFDALEGADAKVTLKCGNPTGGRWEVVEVTGACFKTDVCRQLATDDVDSFIASDLDGKKITKREVVAGTNGKATELCYEVAREATASDVLQTLHSKCTGGAIKSVKGIDGSDVKKHCIFNYDGPGDRIKGDTGDDMFSIKPGASSYLEYIDRSVGLDNKRLRWLSLDGSKEMMIPTGPHAGASQYKDYDIFMNRAPGGVTTQDACYPVNVSLCTTAEVPPKSPPHHGVCGAAHGKDYATVGELKAAGRCYLGNPTEVTEGEDSYTWACNSEPSGYPGQSCSATKQKLGDIVREPPPCNPVARGTKNLDVVFVADNTGSMGSVIEAVQNKAKTMLNKMTGGDSRFYPLDVRFAVANYLHDPSEGSASSGGSGYCPSDPMERERVMREYSPDDPGSPCASGGGIEGEPFTLQQPMTSNKSSIVSAFDGWKAMGGGDLAEGQMNAFKEIVDGSTGWRNDAHHFMIWMGDAPGHEETVSMDSAIAALKSKYIYTMALDSPISFTDPSTGVTTRISSMNDTGQATEIVKATGGIVADISTMTDDQLADLIVNEVYRGYSNVCE